jgi:Nucleotidyl transferase
MMSKPTLVIMAAGMGSRYGGLKQIEPVGPNGETVLSYAVYDAIRAGFGKVVFIIRKDIEAAFRDAIGNKIAAQIEVDYVFQQLDMLPDGFSIPEGREKPWGTAHAILCCKGTVDEPFAVINADDFYGRSSYQILGDYLRAAEESTPPEWSLVGFEIEKTLSPHGSVARGICDVSEDGYLIDVVERLKIEKKGDVIEDAQPDGSTITIPAGSAASMNMWGFTPSLLAELEDGFVRFLEESGTEMKSEYLLPTFVGELVRDGKARVKVLSCAEKWFGVTYKNDLPAFKEAVAARVAAGEYPAGLWDGE